jgi:hypothetical protein
VGNNSGGNWYPTWWSSSGTSWSGGFVAASIIPNGDETLNLGSSAANWLKLYVNTIYFGEENVDGCWRIMRSGNNLNVERRESSVWVLKGAFVP